MRIILRSSFCIRRACNCADSFAILPPMSIRKAGGTWEPMLLGIEPRNCSVCHKGLYRDMTFFRGGWSRCTVCDQFVHYSCLASGKVSFLKQRPRICKACREAQAPASGASTVGGPATQAVGT